MVDVERLKPMHPRRTLVMMTAAIIAGLAAVLASLLNIRVTSYATDQSLVQNTAVLRRIDDRFDSYIADLNATANRQESWARRLCARQEIIAREVGAVRAGWPGCFAPVAALPTSAGAVSARRQAKASPTPKASRTPEPSSSPSGPPPSPSPSPSPSCSALHPGVPCLPPTPHP